MGFDNSFDGLVYTRESIVEQMLLIEKHSTDGSAFRENCKCIQERHLRMVSGLTQEGQTIAKDPKEKEFYHAVNIWAKDTRFNAEKMLEKGDLEAKKLYQCLADEARNIRLSIEHETFIFQAEPVGCSLCVSCKHEVAFEK